MKVKNNSAMTTEIRKSILCYHKLSVSISIYLWIIFLSLSTTAQTLAPNAPGKDAQWATAGKQGVGTSVNLNSKVWFTLAQGVMTEVYYPDVTVANTHLLQFIGVDGSGNTTTEQDDAFHEIKVSKTNSLSFQQINTAKSGSWRITKTYTCDVERNSILIDVKIEKLTDSAPIFFYVYYDPSLNNSGMHDTAWTQNGSLVSQDGNISSALSLFEKVINRTDQSVLGASNFRGFGYSNNGFIGTTGGIDYYTRQFRSEMNHPGIGSDLRDSLRAENGNVAQSGSIFSLIEIGEHLKKKEITLALGFAKTPEAALKNARDSLEKGFSKCQSEYETEWSNYVKTLRKVDPKYQAQFNMAAMILKAHEDKANRGANIASLTVPWGGGDNANENNVGGYHLVWSRDLYQVATAFMALGDKDAAVRALDFLFKVQQKPDGSFPQNSWLDGKPFWGSLQLDEVAFPLILAHELGKTDKETYEKHIKKSADFIVKTGPITPQERWEERTGYSPSTIAAEIAGLVCAAEIAKKNGDMESASRWLKTADEWQQNIEKWTVTTNGKYGDGNYYLRITQKGTPNAGDKIDLGNGAGLFDEREIVDAGFLELVRLGIKSPDDPLIVKSLKVIDDVIRVKTPNGDGFYRYNHDGYGEMDDGRRWNWDGKYTGKGRLWALLSGERGQYELALKSQVQSLKSKVGNPQSATPNPQLRLDSMLAFANEGLMIPEQIWDKAETPKNIDKQFVPELKFGEGTGSATPLAWSMAQFIRLAVNLQEGRNLDTPKVVYDRYVLGKKTENGSQKAKFDISPSCYGEWWDKNKDKKLMKSPVFAKCKDGSVVPIFVYSGEGKSVEAVGDFTEWKSQKLYLTQFQPYAPIAGDFLDFSNYFPLNILAPTARVEYKLIVDGKWITDPLNPNKIDNGVGGENSFFTMPDYKSTTWDNWQGMTKDSIDVISINSSIYGQREIEVYVPEGFEKSALPVMYLQDGKDYGSRAKAITIQRNIVKANKLKPFIMVFLNPKDRMKEYWANDDYAKFLAEEVVPAIDAKYNTIKSREGRAVLGASLGGITAVNVGLKYPQVFSRIGGQSVSWWVNNEQIVKQLDKFDGKFTFYFDDGTLEGVEDSRKAVEILRKKGFEVSYIEGEAGHNWTAWRDRLADAFIAIWR
jgi:glucoamylase